MTPVTQVQKHISLTQKDIDKIYAKADAVGLSFSAFVRVACATYSVGAWDRRDASD